jgi:hypothetical protein
MLSSVLAQVSLSMVRNEIHTPKTDSDGEDQRERLLGATTTTEGYNGITDDGETQGVDPSVVQSSLWDSEPIRFVSDV